jgi:hypothetical protein
LDRYYLFTVNLGKWRNLHDSHCYNGIPRHVNTSAPSPLLCEHRYSLSLPYIFTPTYNQSASFTQNNRGDQAEEWRWGRETFLTRIGPFKILSILVILFKTGLYMGSRFRLWHTSLYTRSLILCILLYAYLYSGMSLPA